MMDGLTPIPRCNLLHNHCPLSPSAMQSFKVEVMTGFVCLGKPSFDLFARQRSDTRNRLPRDKLFLPRRGASV